MKFSVTRSEFDGTINFEGEIRMRDIVDLRLSRTDRALLANDDLQRSPSDYLLVLEMLFRRAAEQGVK